MLYHRVLAIGCVYHRLVCWHLGVYITVLCVGTLVCTLRLVFRLVAEGKLRCRLIFFPLSSTCPPDFYLLKFLIFILHVITGSATFRILAGNSALFYYCVVTLLALRIILCFYCLLLNYEYHFVESMSFPRACFYIGIKTFSPTYFFARVTNILLLKAYILIQTIMFKLRIILMLLISSGSVETNPGPNTNSLKLSFAM